MADGERRERVETMNTGELDRIDDAELVEELSQLTTQTARMRSRMADIIAELDRRRDLAMSSRNSW